MKIAYVGGSGGGGGGLSLPIVAPGVPSIIIENNAETMSFGTDANDNFYTTNDDGNAFSRWGATAYYGLENSSLTNQILADINMGTLSVVATNAGSGSVGNIYGDYRALYPDGGDARDYSYIIGSTDSVYQAGSGSVDQIIGYLAEVSNYGGGSCSNLIGLRSNLRADSGSIEFMYGLLVSATSFAVAPEVLYGVYIDTTFSSGPDGSTWPFYYEGGFSVDKNGAIAIGNSVSAGISLASTNRIAVKVGATTYYLLATTVGP